MNRTINNIRKYGLHRALVYQFGFSDKVIYNFAIVTFLYALINGIISYAIPIFVNESMKSLSLVGVILASSSIGNIYTDLAINFFKKPTSYMGLMRIIAMAILLAFVLMGLPANLLTLFLLAIIWGIYTELFSFAKFNYVTNIDNVDEHAFDHGILNNFFSLGGMIAPILASPMILVGWDLTVITGMVLILVMAVIFSLFKKNGKMPLPIEMKKKNLGLRTEIKLWKKVGFKILPLLVVLFIFGMGEAAILSFTPIFSASREGLRVYSGLILSGFYIPIILFSQYFGKSIDKKGEKIYILFGLLLASISLTFFGFSQHFLIAFMLAFLHGLGVSAFATALASEQSKYIDKHHCQEGRVVGQSGISYNIGFIIGACGAGFIAESFGFGISFRIFGIGYLLVTIIYFIWGPKKMSLKDGEVK